MGFAIIDTAIGLILVFLVVSLICSALREMVESMLKQRALDLERGLRELLHDPDGTGLTSALYTHPLVFGLFSGEYVPLDLKGKRQIWFGSGRNLPSYIPTATFARVVIDLHKSGKINGIYHPEMSELLRALADGTSDTTHFRANIEEWFNGAADRMSGWYKRRTYALLLALGIATALFFNVNAIVIAHELYQRSDLRAAVTASAEKVVAASGEQGPAAPAGATACPENDAECAFTVSVQQLNSLASDGLPIGWRNSGFLERALNKYPWGVGPIVILLGWVATGVAVTFGAPFWFDILSKFVSIRSTMKKLKPETPPPAPAPPVEAAAPALVAPLVATSGAPPLAAAIPMIGVAAVPVAAGPFEPNQWRDFVEGDEEGDL
jgi:hypothetical protein